MHLADSAVSKKVTRVLESGWLTLGTQVRAFEEEFAALSSTRGAVAVTSGTAALHLALRVYFCSHRVPGKHGNR